MQPKHKLANIALKYIEKEKEVCELIETIKQSNDVNIPDEEKEKILKLLDAGGARTALGL